MLKTSPRKLKGDWEAGYALDLHTVSSRFIGYNEYGYAQHKTTRTDVGERLYHLKYHSDESVVRVLGNTAAEFVREKKWPIDLIVTVPPSQQGRETVNLLAKSIGECLSVPVCSDCVVKVKNTPELKCVTDMDKRLEVLEGAYAVTEKDLRDMTVLLVDDLYRSGATVAAVVKSIKTRVHTKGIYLLTFTRTRSKR